MFNVANGTVNVLEDGDSVVNRTKLLLLTEPTELYNSPEFGSGLKRHLWKYNTENEYGIIQDRIRIQLQKSEPFVDASATEFRRGLITTEDYARQPSAVELNHLKMTIGLKTTFGPEVPIDLSDLQSILDGTTTIR